MRSLTIYGHNLDGSDRFGFKAIADFLKDAEFEFFHVPVSAEEIETLGFDSKTTNLKDIDWESDELPCAEGHIHKNTLLFEEFSDAVSSAGAKPSHSLGAAFSLVHAVLRDVPREAVAMAHLHLEFKLVASEENENEFYRVLAIDQTFHTRESFEVEQKDQIMRYLELERMQKPHLN